MSADSFIRRDVNPVKQSMWMSMVVTAVALTTAGCAQLQDAFRSGGSGAATAGAATLTPEQLGNLLGSAKGVELNAQSAELISNLWIDYQLFGQAIAGKTSLKDSALAVRALWPAIHEIKAQRWHDTIIAKKAPVAPGVVDSLYNRSELRVLQHILVKADDPSQNEAAKRRAEQLLADVTAGADFGATASVNSADPGSARDNGYLPPAGPGAYVPEFDAAGRALAPGAVSGLVKTQFGYHIIRRPTQTEAEPRLAAYARQATSRVADSAYMDELITSRKLVVSPDAPAKIKAALGDISGNRKSKVVLASFTGGPLTVQRFLDWAQTAPPQFTQQILAADTAQLQQFAKMLAQNEMVVQQADSAKVQVTADEWKQLYSAYSSEVDSVAATLGVSATGDKKAAAVIVTGYFEKLVNGQARLRPMPQALASVLRDGARTKINAAGVAKALEIAKGIQAKNGITPPGLQPAPGPAPVPGADAPPASTPAPGK